MRIVPSVPKNLLLRIFSDISRDNLFKAGCAGESLFDPMELTQRHSALNQLNHWQ